MHQIAREWVLTYVATVTVFIVLTNALTRMRSSCDGKCWSVLVWTKEEYYGVEEIRLNYERSLPPYLPFHQMHSRSARRRVHRSTVATLLHKEVIHFFNWTLLSCSAQSMSVLYQRTYSVSALHLNVCFLCSVWSSTLTLNRTRLCWLYATNEIHLRYFYPEISLMRFSLFTHTLSPTTRSKIDDEKLLCL